MPCPRCGPSSPWRTSFSRRVGGWKALSRGAARYARAKLVDRDSPDTSRRVAVRLEVCRTCPVRHLESGVAYCGKPLWERQGDSAEIGCGCILEVKAQAPDEHCPLKAGDAPASPASANPCSCLWCTADAQSR